MERQSNNINSNQIVKLNIGGYKYETTVNTLTSGKPNFFSSLLQNNMPSFKDENGYYFIDRDGKYFEPILEFLRTGEINFSPDLPKEVSNFSYFFIILIFPINQGNI